MCVRAHVINRAARLSDGTVGRSPVPPRDTGDSCVEQKTGGEQDTDDDLTASAAQRMTPLSAAAAVRLQSTAVSN